METPAHDEDWQHGEDAHIPARFRPILEQLIAGHTDATASRNLNMSSRTFTRRVAELMDYCGARTRFQCGMEIMRRGWTDSRTPTRHDP
ncbi:hypothetical protein [Spirillospora sp. NPDC047279]|uniref:hypothetical protein n=1 Tax=Spirillospora sp. NPDC047279 TaxID=3155478 RepID=UPI00340CC264